MQTTTTEWIPISWSTGYNGDENELMSLDTGLDCSEDLDRAVQSEKNDADINEIMRRFGRTGTVPTPHEIPFYGDFSDVTDYQTALNDLRAAQDAFSALPSKIRNRFENDPAQLLNFIHNDANYDEAVEIGLIPPKEVAPPPAPPPT